MSDQLFDKNSLWDELDIPQKGVVGQEEMILLKLYFQ